VSVDTPELRALLREAAANGVVLLKNDSKILPLNASSVKGKKIAVIGSNAKVAFPSGGGSASLATTYTVSPLEGITEAATELGATVDFHIGTAAFRYVPLLDPYITNPRTGEQGALVEFFNGAPGENWFVDASPPSPSTVDGSFWLNKAKSGRADFAVDTKCSECFMMDGVDWSQFDSEVRSRVRFVLLLFFAFLSCVSRRSSLLRIES
jgi:beta-glucosidase